MNKEAIVGYGKRACLGDFIVVTRHDKTEIRGVLIEITRMQRHPNLAMKTEGMTPIRVTIQEDPLQYPDGISGPTSFYWNKKDKIIRVAPNHMMNMLRYGFGLYKGGK